MDTDKLEVYVKLAGILIPLGRGIISDIRKAVTEPNPETAAVLDGAEADWDAVRRKARQELGLEV